MIHWIFLTSPKNLCRFPFPPWGPFPFRLIPYWLPPFIGRIGIRGFSRSNIVSSSEEFTLQKVYVGEKDFPKVTPPPTFCQKVRLSASDD